MTGHWGFSVRSLWAAVSSCLLTIEIERSTFEKRRHVVIVRGSWPFPGREPKGTLVNCSWLVWSSPCVGCVTPYWGFGVWWQLAREPPSEWIATTRTSLPASKWTSVKIIVFILWFWGDWSSLLFILVIDWFIHLHGGIIFLITFFTLSTSWQTL